MKKITLIAALAVMALTASAQGAFKKSGVADNMSISLQGGVYEPMYGGDFFNDMRPVVRLSLNKYFNTVMGVSLYGEAFINNNNGNPYTFVEFPLDKGYKTTVDFSNVGANALVNLSNLFCGYKGQPRVFEVAAEAGLGWLHCYAHPYGTGDDVNSFATTNLALDFNFNVAKKWQINLRPALTYVEPAHFWHFDIRDAVMQLTAGVTYKIGSDFTFCDKLYTQADLDACNAKVNGLRGDLDAANRRIAELQSALAAERAKEKTVVNNVVQGKLAPVVIFDKAKYEINKSQEPSISMIASYMQAHPNCKVTVKGYASPEGKAEFNQELSVNRANAVKDVLVNTYKIDESRIKAIGYGATSEIFPENDWNRVVTFVEE